MTLLRFHLPALLLALGAVAPSSLLAEEAPGCPSWDIGVPVPPEHADDACDLTHENAPTRRKLENDGLFFAKNSGSLQRLGDEQTWICPNDDAAAAGLSADGDSVTTGALTRWVVRNGASNPVSVALVDPTRNNLEVSAVNPKVHPAHHDPEAVLQPGQSAIVDTTYGALLHVRELVRVGNGVAPGRVLVRHRPGTIPVGRTFAPGAAMVGVGSAAAAGQQQVQPASKSAAAPDTTSSVPSLKDAFSVGEETLLIPTQEARSIQKDASQKRTRATFGSRKCNSINKLFANRSGRPLDVYYAGAVDMTVGGGGGSAEHGGSTCNAQLICTLGTTTTGATQHGASNMHMENTYVGHKFVAKLRSDPSIVVEEFVIERTEVKDCPRERKARAGGSAKLDVAADVLHGEGEGEDSDEMLSSFEDYDAVLGNATKIHFGTVVAEMAPAGRTGEALIGVAGSVM